MCTVAQARNVGPDNVKTSGYKYLDSSFKTYHAISTRIHSYAEPGYQEYKSVAELSEHLKSHGFDIRMGVGGIPTAFTASYGSGHPVIGIIGEYDALPGMSQDTVAHKQAVKEGAYGHGCGHNMFGTAAAAACVAVSKWLAEGHKGTVVFLGCPAEEGGGGKSFMTREGCFDGIDMVFDWHPGSMNEVSLDTWMANINVVFSFHGVSAHAGGSPWKGRSALDAAEIFNLSMNMMREHVPDGTRIHYVYKNGGEAPNIVPDLAQVNYYFRSADTDVMLDVLERAKKAAEGASLCTGTTWDFEVLNGNYPKLINRKLSEVVCRNLNRVGGVRLDEREKAFALEVLANSPDVKDKTDLSNFERVCPEVRPARPNGLSTDVGSVSQVAPLASLRVSTFTIAGGDHCWQNAATAGTTIGTKALMNVARIFYLSALDIYKDPKLAEEIRREFGAVHGPGYKFVPLMGNRKPPFDYRKK